jgi:hypothetical protein
MTALRKAVASFAVILILGNVSQAAAQERDREKVDLVGVVVDLRTGEAVTGAYVEVSPRDRETYTDRDGRFKIGGLQEGRYAIRVEQLGYESGTLRHELVVGGGPARIELVPDPVMLEEIEVINNRLARRRNSAPYSVRAFDATQLATSSAFDALDFVRMHLFTAPCPSFSFGNTCVRRRGRAVSPRVYVDDAPFLGGLDVLMSYPMSELYLIEVLDSGSQVRIYTKWFASRVAEGKARILPYYSF